MGCLVKCGINGGGRPWFGLIFDCVCVVLDSPRQYEVLLKIK